MTTLIEKTSAYVRSLTKDEQTGHDWQHTLRVLNMAKRLADDQTGPCDRDVIVLACLLYDVKDYKLSGDENAGPQAAYAWLSSNGANPLVIEHVVSIISTMSFKGQVHRPMDTLEGQIVQDADRLDAVGAIGIARAFAFGGAQGRPIYDPELPYRKDLDQKTYKVKTQKTASLNHFYEKLLKLDGHYHTDLANQIGHERHLFMKAYLQRFLEDSGESESSFYQDLRSY